MVEIRPLALEGVLELRPRRWHDERGFFSEVWRDDWFRETDPKLSFVQDNHSFSNRRGVVRGLHFQCPPAAQDKLIRVSHGSIFDVAVDIRSSSATFGQWVGLTLSAEDWNQLFIPKGFAHGFVALEDGTEVLYKVSHAYSPELDRSIRYDDPLVGIDWPVAADEISISKKDSAAPLLSEIETGF